MASVAAADDGCDDVITTQPPEGCLDRDSPASSSSRSGSVSSSRRYVRSSAAGLQQECDEFMSEMEGGASGPLVASSPKPQSHRASEVFRVKQRLNNSERKKVAAKKPKLGFDNDVQKFYAKVVHEPAGSATAEPDTLPYSKILAYTHQLRSETSA